MTLEFRVDGDPVPWPRPRFVSSGFSVRSFVDPKVAAWKATVGWAARAAGCTRLEGPLDVELAFRLRAPKVRKPQHAHATSLRTGDVDNLAKSILDALNDIAWRDDSQVVELVAAKSYAAPGEVPGVRVRVTPAEGPS